MKNTKGKNKNLPNSSKKSKKVSKAKKKNEAIGPFNKIDKKYSNNLNPKNLPSPTKEKNEIDEIKNELDKNFDKKEKKKDQHQNSQISLNNDKNLSDKKSLINLGIVKNESFHFYCLFINNYKYKLGKLIINNFYYYDIKNKSKNPIKHSYYSIKISEIKNSSKNKIVKAESLKFNHFNILVKNSYKYKMGILNIKNFFYYDINSKSKNFKKRINDEIKFIDNTNKDIIKENTNEINLFNDNDKNKQKIFINDIYYNKKFGLQNFGCTCYFNSFIQIIIHIPRLIESLMDYKESIQMNKNLLLYYLIKFAEYPSSENLYELRREFIRKNSDYRHYGQEDSQEFGAEFLKILNNELTDLNYFIGLWKLDDGFNLKNIKVNTVKEKLDKLYALIQNEDCDFQNQTIINFYFYYYETELIICNNKIVNYNYSGDVDNQLSFDTNDKYKDNLNLIDMLKKKYLNGYHKFIKLPIILNITLLRAIIGAPLIKTKVLINMNIDLKDFLDKDFGDYSLPTEYTLYALNVCYGSFKMSGHYYSYILINNKWIKYDDSIVKEVTKKSIEEDLPYIYGIYYINKEYLNSLNDK